MTVDAQAALATLLYIFAYGAPAWLTWRHLLKDGAGSAGPPLFASLVATLAILAMNGRTGMFLDGNVPEPEAGPFSKQVWVALYTAGAAAFGLAVFAWILPVLGRRTARLLEHLRPPAEDPPAAQAPSRSILDYSAPSPVRRSIAALRASTAHVAAIAACFLALAVYLLWPALPLAVDLQRRISDHAAAAQREAAEHANRSAVRRLAVNAGVRANELVSALSARRQSCRTEACTDYSSRRLQQVVTTLAGWRVSPGAGGIYTVEHFATSLRDLDAIGAVHDRLEDLARRNRVVLPPRPELAAETPFDAADTERSERSAFERNMAGVGEQLYALKDPRRAVALIASDTTMVLAIGLELIAIALTVAAGFSGRGAR